MAEMNARDQEGTLNQAIYAVFHEQRAIEAAATITAPARQGTGEPAAAASVSTMPAENEDSEQFDSPESPPEEAFYALVTDSESEASEYTNEDASEDTDEESESSELSDSSESREGREPVSDCDHVVFYGVVVVSDTDDDSDNDR